MFLLRIFLIRLEVKSGSVVSCDIIVYSNEMVQQSIVKYLANSMLRFIECHLRPH